MSWVNSNKTLAIKKIFWKGGFFWKKIKTPPSSQINFLKRPNKILGVTQDDDMSSYVTKSHLFGAQRALHQEQQAMSDRIDNLATDLRLSEQRTRDYFDNKLDAHKQENDARMDQIRALLVNRPP